MYVLYVIGIVLILAITTLLVAAVLRQQRPSRQRNDQPWMTPDNPAYKKAIEDVRREWGRQKEDTA